MTSRRGPHPTRGFSLLEVLVAGSLFLVGMAGVLTSFNTISGLAEAQQRQVDAVAVAEDVLDELRLQGRGGQLLTVGGHERHFDRDRRVVGSDGTYVVRWQVEQVGTHSFRRVDLNVRYRTTNGLEHTISFVTFRPG